MSWEIETLDDVEDVRRWLSAQVRQGNALARRLLRALDNVAPGAEIATARLVVATVFKVAAEAETTLRERYRAAGEPYGADDEGLRRWDAEQQEAERRRRSQLN
ncbi:MAG TPA: hypothetical protein VMU89_09050 [Thermomicrobiaceae bacterium]|nr:hypothetical protein [Thermomicrobiaceae bacterium]